MSQASQEKPVGNTISTGTQNQLYRWFFTLKMDSITEIQLFEILKEISKQFTFQGEKGAQGFEHWQGVFSLKTKERFATVKNLFPVAIHLEGCIDWFKARNYCMKSDTHICGPYNENSTFIKVIDKLYKWQEDLRKELLEGKEDDRKIIVYVDKAGGCGKSQFCKLMAVKYGAVVLQSGSKKDISFSLPDQPKIILFNLTRDVEDRLSYDAIESIKDGMIFSAKYESKMKLFNSPHVVIFSNFELDYSRMTEDRWDVRKLDKNVLSFYV